MRHGPGVQVWPDNAKYEGEWRENKANMAAASSGMLTVTSMRASGKMTRPTASESTSTSTVPSMRATGRTTSKMARAWRAGKTAAVTNADTKRA